MSNRADLWAISCFEPLENRMMLSTSYDLMSLMGYNHLGASWKYSSSISMIGPDGGDDSFSQTTKIAIGSKKAKYDNHLSAIVRTGNSQASLSTAWYTTSGGTYQSLSTMFAGIDGFTINLHDTCLAPKSMRIGQAFKDSGTFDGTLSFPSFDEDHPLTGSFNGTDSVATSLAKMQTIKTRAGTFNAVKGTYAVGLKGTLKIKYRGQSITGNFAATETLTFWAVPNVGIVKQVAGLNITMSSGGENNSSTINQTSTLLSYSLP